MSVIAKFKCTEKTVTENGDKIKLNPVYSSDPNSENGKFFKWTPYGSIEMGTVNPDAAAYFEVGKEYLITFNKADDQAS